MSNEYPKRLEVWVTSDGKQYKDQACAVEAEAALAVNRRLVKFLQKHGGQHGGPNKMNSQDIADLLVDNAGELYDIIKGYVE